MMFGWPWSSRIVLNILMAVSRHSTRNWSASPLGVMGIISFLLIGYTTAFALATLDIMIDPDSHCGLMKKTNETCLCMVGFAIPNIAGTIVLLTVEQRGKTKGRFVAAFYIMQFLGAVSSPRPIKLREATAADEE